MAETRAIGVVEENVLIGVGDCSVTILPDVGGKIASIQVGGRELLQAPLAAYAPRTRTMLFDAGDGSGWDECLPSIGACEVETTAGLAEVPDHGDLWRVEWSEIGDGRSEGARGASVTLRGECFSLPLALERTLTLIETEKGWRLSLDYTVTNIGDCPAPWSWAAHPLFAVEAGDRIVLPDSIRQVRLEGSVTGRLGLGGQLVAWPIAALADGGETDLSVVQPPESRIGDKLFAGPLPAADNWCALERPRAGVRIKVGFDPVATPYIGLWICYGGWPERPGPRQMCVALEPTTALVDSLAISGPWSRVLSPSDSFSWPMVVDFEVL
jgi:galactose mutarotase-like enzyme